ncbi:bromodomain-containing protein 8 [Onthophagus taurus]|uniref:bromodomain-containing protein 8 n=1 Tax=Onthophagus taurus TaxID=166361 RepID=UPI0039BDDDE8
MTSIQERLQIKREPLDKWSIREQLCLASAVARSGDQNWMSVCRALKPFGDANRPNDWFHQKNCAAQYWALLENVETPKRKKRPSGTQEAGIETPAESILKKLKGERLAELKKVLAEEKNEYTQLQDDMNLLNSGNVSEEQLDKWCKEIDDEEKEKDQEAVNHAKWLKEREVRKQEIERAWRPLVKVNVNAGNKRKSSDSVDNQTEGETPMEEGTPTQTPEKSAQSPLLTSLLKTPSHAQTVATSSILHTAMSNQRPTTTNPTIASLLNSSTNVTVSPSLQQLVSTAIGQEPQTAVQVVETEIVTTDNIDDPDNILTNIKVEDIESTILASGDTLPEIKDEEVEVIISDLIQNGEIVADPEEHLQLDGNVDLMENLENELQELVKEEENAAALIESVIQSKDESSVEVDPFEFQEEEIYDQPQLKVTAQQEKEIEVKEEVEVFEQQKPQIQEAKEVVEEPKKGSVEIVEVVVMEDEEIDKELNKSQIENIVHSNPKIKIIGSVEDLKEEIKDEEDLKEDSCEESTAESPDTETKSDLDTIKDTPSTETNETETTEDTQTADLNDDLFDMEVKIDKSGKAKRDYTRTSKKKEEKDLDLLFVLDRTTTMEEEQETCSEKEFSEYENIKKDVKRIKLDNERSNSPWTEEDDVISLKSKRRYSTTPVDSIPNSPGSTTTNEEEREYKNWKKSVLLLYNRLATHKYSSLFLKPITDEQAPGYHTTIYRPMDLLTIRKNIENGSIRTTVELQRDVLLMYNNAIMYNKTSDHVYNMATEAQQEGIQQIQLFVQAQQADAPVRRETRTGEREPTGKRKRGSEEPTRSSKKRKDD